jgi:Flp pilus assembly protein TadB
MSGIKPALLLGALPIAVSFLYFVVERTFGSPLTIDPAGGTMLVALGLAMGFGAFVLLRGARDI